MNTSFTKNSFSKLIKKMNLSIKFITIKKVKYSPEASGTGRSRTELIVLKLDTRNSLLCWNHDDWNATRQNYWTDLVNLTPGFRDMVPVVNFVLSCLGGSLNIVSCQKRNFSRKKFGQKRLKVPVKIRPCFGSVWSTLDETPSNRFLGKLNIE